MHVGVYISDCYVIYIYMYNYGNHLSLLLCISTQLRDRGSTRTDGTTPLHIAAGHGNCLLSRARCFLFLFVLLVPPGNVTLLWKIVDLPD